MALKGKSGGKRRSFVSQKVCRFCVVKLEYIDFFDIFLLCGDELGEILIYNLR